MTTANELADINAVQAASGHPRPAWATDWDENRDHDHALEGIIWHSPCRTVAGFELSLGRYDTAVTPDGRWGVAEATAVWIDDTLISLTDVALLAAELIRLVMTAGKEDQA